MVQFKDYVALVRKTAWSFNKTTGIGYEQLFSEGSEIFVKAAKEWDPEKSAFSTFLYLRLKTGLINSCKKRGSSLEDQQGKKEEHEPWEDRFPGGFCPEQRTCFMDQLSKMEEHSRSICQIIFKDPTAFIIPNRPKLSRGLVMKALRKQGWKEPEIWSGFQEIKKVLNEKV